MFKTEMYGTDFWTLWERARVGCFKRTASKHVYYLWWNRSPAQVGCMRQVLGPGALGRPRGIWWRGRWGTHVNPWLNHFNVWQNPLQYCRVIGLQLIRKKKNSMAKQNRKRDTDVQNRLLDSVGEGEGGMFQENSIETCILWSPAQAGCMRQVLGPGALGRPRGIG